MIKQLIKDLAFDNIILLKGLTRAKVIATKINNEVFRAWLKNELEGYNYSNENLPDYRKIRCVIYLVAELPFGRKHSFPISFDRDDDDPKFIDIVRYHRVTEPVAIIEQNLKRLISPKAHIHLTPEQVEIFERSFEKKIAQHNGVIRSGYMEVGKVQYENILELTKQKLLDTLLELDTEFPDLENDFNMTEDNLHKVQNIITNNIYGNNNPLNVAAGQSVVQKEISVTYSQEEYEELKQLGVEEEKIIELKNMVENESKDKFTLKTKALKWLGSVTSSIAARGLYDNIPAITEFMHRLL
ncbi:MAG: hypothetical protein IPJ81_11855 [Chitinophagaceae bacterium]|nr:hypothetical protein [Chitinophagaceae bacterium]